MTEQELVQLEALAKAATPGPWGVLSSPLASLGGELPGTEREEYHISTSWEWPGEKVVSRAYRGWATRPNGVHLSKDDAAYIAAMHPGTALGLVAEVRRLRGIAESCDAWKWECEQCNAENRGLRGALNRALSTSREEAEVQRLRALVESAYREGWKEMEFRDSYGDEREVTQLNFDWEESAARKALGEP